MGKINDKETAMAMKAFAQVLHENLPNDCKGFIIITFPFFDMNGDTNYISNADRQGAIKALRDTANRLEKEPNN